MPDDIARHIDHTLLRPDSTRSDIDLLCQEARQYHFAAVCVPPTYVKRAVQQLDQTDIAIATVVGFPLGYTSRAAKRYETSDALAKGATEIDMVINIGAVKDRRWHFLQREIRSLTAEAHRQKALIKVIIETALLSPDEIVSLCDICAYCHADFVKTSTGFSHAGADVATVQLMRNVLPDSVRIKAAGGIRTREFALSLINTGADRLGCSQSVAICQ